MEETDFRVDGRLVRVRYGRRGAELVVSARGETFSAVPEFLGENLVCLRHGNRHAAVWVAVSDGIVHAAVDGEIYRFEKATTEARAEIPEDGRNGAGIAAGRHQIFAPIPGTVLKVLVEEGQNVPAGRRLLLLEAMKMENAVDAPAGGTVARILVKPGDSVRLGEPLLELTVE